MAARTLDVFPARVLDSDGTQLVSNARVVRNLGGRVDVYVQASAEHPGDAELNGGRIARVLTLDDAAVTPSLGSNRRPRWELTSSEQTIVVEKAGGCGCGSPLKRFSPP